MDRFQRVAKAAQEFPAEFAMRSWPKDKRFRVNVNKSYVNSSDEIQLVVETHCGGLGWLDLSRGTPSELRRLVITQAKEA